MAGRHHSQSLSSSRSRVNSNSSSYFAERDSSRDYSYRDRDHHDGRDPYHSKDKDRDKLHDRDSDRHRDKDRERERDRDRDRDRDRGRYRQDDADFNRAVTDRPSSGATSSKAGFLRLSRSLSSEDSPDSSSSLSGQREKDTEREPGELSSGSRSEEAGDGAVAGQRSSGRSASKRSQHHQGGNDGDVSKGDSPSSAAVPKKRKFSPIVWDLDEKPHLQKGSSFSSTAGASLSKASPAKSRQLASPPLPPPPPSASLSPQLPLPPPPPLPVSRSATPKHNTPPSNVARGTPPISSTGRSSTPPFSGANVSAARALHLPPSKAAASQKASESSRSFTPSPPSPKHTHYSDSSADKDQKEAETQMNSPYTQDEPLLGHLFDTPPQVDEAEMGPVPRINIAASRWAEETASPSEGRSPYTSIGKSKARHPHSSESDEGHLSSDENGGRQASENSMSPEPGEYVKDKFESLAEGSGGIKEPDVRLDEQYDRELNERELMDIDDEAEHDEEEEEHPEVDSEEEEPPPVPPAPPQRMINMLQGCRSVDEFEKLNKIDEGTYGVVYRARNKKTGEIVALKKVKMEKEREGFPMTSLREINVLLSIHHPSVVDVKEVVVGSNLDSIYMVMEYMEHDLKGLMETIKQPFSQSEVKCLMLQLFEGVKYLHDNWVLHRDLKTSNLLLNNRGELKICDFGLARQYGSPLKTYTHMVVTLWYRAPELLLGAKQYSTAVDMWSLGCIMAEFLAKEPLFNGKSEVDQLDKIFKILGTPNETIWPDFAKLPGVKCNFVRQPFNRLREKFPPTAFAGRPPLSESGFNLLNRLLLYDPKKRITAEEALNHEWFKEVPLPKMKELMPTYPARSEHERRSRRLMKSPDPLAEQRKRELRQAELGAGGLFG